MQFNVTYNVPMQRGRKVIIQRSVSGWRETTSELLEVFISEYVRQGFAVYRPSDSVILLSDPARGTRIIEIKR